MVEAMVTSAKTTFHWEKIFIKTMNWKNRFATSISKGRSPVSFILIIKVNGTDKLKIF